METATLNPTQMHLLKLFAFNNSEEYAREIQMVLTKHFQSRLDAEADRLWDEGILKGHLHNHVGLTENFDQSENEEFLVNDSWKSRARLTPEGKRR